MPPAMVWMAVRRVSIRNAVYNEHRPVGYGVLLPQSVGPSRGPTSASFRNPCSAELASRAASGNRVTHLAAPRDILVGVSKLRRGLKSGFVRGNSCFFARRDDFAIWTRQCHEVG